MTARQQNDIVILCLLGALSLVSPFAIDLYLPAFSSMATDFGTSSAAISLSVSSYFIGLAFGQFIYGPLLDRFGRKKPIYAGLSIFILASIGCMMTTDIETLVVLRLIQALGGCVAEVGAITMVGDFFPVEKRAKIFSLLFLFIGVSPLCAPTFGSIVTAYLGWQWVFAGMALIVGTVLAAVVFLLPEGRQPDLSVSLKPASVARTFIDIFNDNTFRRYLLASAFSFAGLFTFVAGAPIIFLEEFHVGTRTFGLLFAILAGGFIAGSQINIWLLRRYGSDRIFSWALYVQSGCSLFFMAGAWMGWFGLPATILLFFILLFCIGISNPNGSALALEPFSKNAGSASALLGALQLGTGALVSTLVGIFGTTGSLPVITILCLTGLAGLAFYKFLRVPAPAL